MNKMTRILRISVVVFMFIIVAYFSGNSATNSGIIRVKLYPFTYLNDPEGVSYNSHGKLGDLGAYILRIYTETEMQNFLDTAKSSEEMSGEGVINSITYYPNKDKYMDFKPQSEASSLCKNNREGIVNIFRKGGRILFAVDGRSTPLYFDIPAPAGKYYIEYSLIFPQSKVLSTMIHPNYPHLSRTDSSIIWGPAKVIVYKDQVANIEFKPTHNITFYKHNERNSMFYESTDGLWDWIKYLLWAGVL